MKIAFNVLSAQMGGGVSVLTNLLPQLARIDQKNSYTIFYSSRQREFVEVIPESFQKVVVDYLPSNPFVRVFWEQFIFPFYLLWHRIDLLYSVGNTTSVLAPCKVVLLIENANPYSRLPLPWSRKERMRFALLRWLGLLSAHRATVIRFVSTNSRDLMLGQLHLGTEKCVVIPHGVLLRDTVARAQEPPPCPTPYLLIVGANGPHRNTDRLLHAFALLVTRYGYRGNLVILGSLGSPAHAESVRCTIEQLGIADRVFLGGEIPHHHIASYYLHADAFVFPSLEETFGIPLIEAMGLGTSIITSDGDLDRQYRGNYFTPFREICGDAAAYCNPFDVDDIARVIYETLSDPTGRTLRIATGKERVQQYRLETVAHTLVQLFERAYNT